MSSLRLAVSLLHKRPLSMIYRCSGSSWTWSTQRASFSSETGSGDTLQNKSSAPLDPEWVEMAKKQLKGADPQEKLTWRTPEVQIHVG